VTLAVYVTAVEARACARGRVREDREWSIYSENHATGTSKTKTRGSRLGSPYYYMYYYLTLVVVGVVPVIVVEVEPGGVVDFMPHASKWTAAARASQAWMSTSSSQSLTFVSTLLAVAWGGEVA